MKTICRSFVLLQGPPHDIPRHFIIGIPRQRQQFKYGRSIWWSISLVYSQQNTNTGINQFSGLEIIVILTWVESLNIAIHFRKWMTAMMSKRILVPYFISPFDLLFSGFINYRVRHPKQIKLLTNSNWDCALNHNLVHAIRSAVHEAIRQYVQIGSCWC
jgi:hypothetical protein